MDKNNDKALQERLEWVAKIQGSPDILEIDPAEQDNRYEVMCPKCEFTEVILPQNRPQSGLLGAKFTCRKCGKTFRSR